MANRFVLDPAATLIRLGVGQAHQLERVGDLSDMTQTLLEGLSSGLGGDNDLFNFYAYKYEQTG